MVLGQNQKQLNMNKVEVVSIEELPKNDRLCYKEIFSIKKDKLIENIIYCHSNFDIKNKKDLSLYSKQFCDLVNIFQRFIFPGDVALDIGAYDGDTTLPIAHLCGKFGKTYAFECGEAFCSKLSVNAGFNPHLNIELIPAALMPESGIHTFLYCPTDYNGGHHSTNSWVGTYTVPRLVRGISFEDFSKGKDLSKLSFIKVDAEGHDFHILWSFKDFIKTVKPVIHAEWFPQTDLYIKELADYIGYETFCGFTLEPITIGISSWRQDILLIPRENLNKYDLSIIKQ